MNNVEIKLYGFIKANKKQFLVIYGIAGSIFIFLTIFFWFYKFPNANPETIYEKWIIENFSLFWFIMLMFLVIEGQFYWNKFTKKQVKIISQQKQKIEKQKRSITDSIEYASRIQNAVMPSVDSLKEKFPQSFIYFKPRDIVSGDFFWFTQKDDSIIVAVADCTGHGVPGAFMSMLGISFLDEIVVKNNITSPANVLNMLRKMVKEALHQDKDESQPKDGMDIALCNIKPADNKLFFAGAYNSLLICRNEKIIKIPANRQPIGVYLKEKDFEQHEVKLQKNDMLYMYSDGIVDQTGGESGEKFKSRRLRELILESAKLDSEIQYEKFDRTLQQWTQNRYNQVDDIVITGIRIE